MKRSFFLLCVLVISCRNDSKPGSNLAGNYEVKIELRDHLVNKDAIRDSVMLALRTAKEAITNLQNDPGLDLSKVDTGTAEGKIEYAAKMLAKELALLGKDVGGLGTGIAEMAGKAAETGLDLADSIIRNFSFDIQLNDDGTISGGKSGLGKMSMDHSHWSQQGDVLYLSSANGNEREAFQINNRSEKGFTLTKEKVNLIFTKK